MSSDIRILVDPQISPKLIIELEKPLMDIFPFDSVDLRKDIQVPSSCWNASRHQFNANCLLTFATSLFPAGIVVLLISKDAYVQELNFVFGIASKGIGAVVSTYRLENDPEFVKKEIIHELGHVFGLSHCSLPCVMTFSNSVWEARLKSVTFCEKCRKEMNSYITKSKI
ncbi:MAG: archemetzincin [Candidatus Thorarchaeota archaeon]